MSRRFDPARKRKAQVLIVYLHANHEDDRIDSIGYGEASCFVYGPQWWMDFNQNQLEMCWQAMDMLHPALPKEIVEKIIHPYLWKPRALLWSKRGTRLTIAIRYKTDSERDCSQWAVMDTSSPVWGPCADNLNDFLFDPHYDDIYGKWSLDFDGLQNSTRRMKTLKLTREDFYKFIKIFYALLFVIALLTRP